MAEAGPSENGLGAGVDAKGADAKGARQPAYLPRGLLNTGNSSAMKQRECETRPASTRERTACETVTL
eukprot:2149750-Pyramimonas_sp.AAC.1